MDIKEYSFKQNRSKKKSQEKFKNTINQMKVKNQHIKAFGMQ